MPPNRPVMTLTRLQRFGDEIEKIMLVRRPRLAESLGLEAGS